MPPKKIAPPLPALVLMLLEPAKVVGTAGVIVREFAMMFAPIETVLVPAADEMSISPSLTPPTIPVKVMAPADPAFKVRD